VCLLLFTRPQLLLFGRPPRDSPRGRLEARIEGDLPMPSRSPSPSVRGSRKHVTSALPPPSPSTSGDSYKLPLPESVQLVTHHHASGDEWSQSKKFRSSIDPASATRPPLRLDIGGPAGSDDYRRSSQRPHESTQPHVQMYSNGTARAGRRVSSGMPGRTSGSSRGQTASVGSSHSLANVVGRPVQGTP
jgi:hypothetical protein